MPPLEKVRRVSLRHVRCYAWGRRMCGAVLCFAMRSARSRMLAAVVRSCFCYHCSPVHSSNFLSMPCACVCVRVRVRVRVCA